jgi:L,D-peptidoglycan transpeptidase YkuD (ErfK/YbiS/YcfS/YnhG family)
VLLVTVENASTSYADITYYEKNGGIWKEVFSTKGRVGRNGIIPEEQRMQDTYKTPAGILKIIGAFGTSPDPGTAFDYIAVTGNMYWDLNSGSPTYNRLVYSDPGGQKEHLIEYGQKYGTYKYALITDYNYEQAAGKGGAIFIHCNGAGDTAGCVSMPESYMKTLVASVAPAKNPAVIITLKSELSNYMS